MGLLQKAVETYDAMAHRAGQDHAEEKEPLAPVSHITVRSHIQIELDRDGSFISARAVEKDSPKIIIPVTEESAGRTSAPCAHPLCEQLGYLAPSDPKKEGLYLAALAGWADSPFSHPMLKPILTYVKSGTILTDLSRTGVIQVDQDGTPRDEKALVRWVVNGLGEGVSGECWRSRSLMDAFTQYYAAARPAAESVLCMVSGESQSPASQHPKGIIPKPNGAKLISSNDFSGFTFRGRFTSDSQAATVGYAASQKAHSALRWLVANEGVLFGGRTFLCWDPQGNPLPPVCRPMAPKGGALRRSATPTQYRRQLRDALSGWRNDLPTRTGVVIAAFDAATTGRLSVTYYNELMASDFLERLAAWDGSCCWENGPYGIQSPSLFQIVSWAFGTPRNGKTEIDDRILAQQMQRLVACRVDQASFPLDIERALVEKASNLQLYQGNTPEETKKLRGQLLFTACAAIRKYHCDHSKNTKEEWNMALNKDCKDRSYLFGRLLAIAEAVERSTYDSSEDARESNALRMQRAYALRPLSGWRTLEEKLEPYYKQLPIKLRQYYRNMTQEIMDKLEIPTEERERKEKMAELNRKLDDIYLLGYYHQRAYRNEKDNPQATEENSEEE